MGAAAINSRSDTAPHTLYLSSQMMTVHSPIISLNDALIELHQVKQK